MNLQKEGLFWMKEHGDLHEYLQKGANYCRQETADLSLKMVIALKTKKAHLFLNKNKALKKVSNFYPDLDFEKKYEVAKMLHVIAKRLYVEKSIERNLELKE